jgi:hypothetical protein
MFGRRLHPGEAEHYVGIQRPRQVFVFHSREGSSRIEGVFAEGGPQYGT